MEKCGVISDSSDGNATWVGGWLVCGCVRNRDGGGRVRGRLGGKGKGGGWIKRR